MPVLASCRTRMSWLAAGRRLLAPFGRESATDLHARAVIFPEVPDAVRALARHARIVVVANADHDYLMRCLTTTACASRSWTPNPPAATSRTRGSSSARATHSWISPPMTFRHHIRTAARSVTELSTMSLLS